MKKLTRGLLALAVVGCTLPAQAGNDQKRGQAGATELTVNPWGRSAGWANANTAGIRGVEAMNSNVGGLAYVQGTEVLFTTTRWLEGTGVNVNAAGVGQQLGKSGGVLGISVVSWSLGKFYQTAGAMPDNDITFTPRMLNVAMSYAKVFSNAITGGLTVRYLTESVPDASATGVSVDGAVQYQTHLGGADPERRNLKFGVALRNVGPELRFSGSGLTYRAGSVASLGGDNTRALSGPSESFEMPTMLTIGGQYDVVPTEDHRLTVAANFVSNTFSQDQYQGGLEYAFMERFMVRGGYDFMKRGDLNNERTVAHTGLTAGASVEVPFGKSADEDADQKQHRLAIDYAYRHSNPWQGSHSVGIRLVL